MIDLKERVINILKQRESLTGGKNGLTLPCIRKILDCDFSDLKILMNDLYKNGSIKINEGINGKLIQINYEH